MTAAAAAATGCPTNTWADSKTLLLNMLVILVVLVVLVVLVALVVLQCQN